jgi:riboflavin kinase/FMN adenylyltransferase
MLARDKVATLRGLGIDSVGLLRFDAKMAAITAEDFVRDMLVRRLGAREVWIGPRFHFGHRRGGDLALLQAMGAELGFVAGEIAPVHLNGERISSTRIRELLVAGEFEHAADLLGRPYAIGGRVVRGQQLGRTLGFPTANLRFPRTPALSGIYATWVHGVSGDSGRGGPWPSVSSFGTRPTVQGVEPLLEAHLFDFQGDLYGRHIEVEFVAKLRDEEKFNDLPALTAQMHRDAEQARTLLNEHASPSQQPAHPCADAGNASPSQQPAHPCADAENASPSQQPAHPCADSSITAAQG